jgi:hypothetical protein
MVLRLPSGVRPLEKKSRWGGSRFHSAGPRDVRDGRMVDCHDFSRAVPETFTMVGWSTDTRMVAVVVAIARRGHRDVSGWSMSESTRERGWRLARPVPMIGMVEGDRVSVRVDGRSGQIAFDGSEAQEGMVRRCRGIG